MYQQGSFQDTPDTAEADGHAVFVRNVVPDDLGTALKYCPEFNNPSDNVRGDRCRVGVWPGCQGWNPPLACSKPPYRTRFSRWPVVVGELDVGIEGIPLALPSPQRLATTCVRSPSRMSSCRAIALAFGKLGLVEYAMVGSSLFRWY